MTDDSGDIDVVERALAILEEECRSWTARRPIPASGEVEPPPARQQGEDR